jgi:hypothetical protein
MDFIFSHKGFAHVETEQNGRRFRLVAVLSMPTRENGVNAFVERPCPSVNFGDERRVMRKLIYSLMVATVSLGFTAGLARGDERTGKDELEARAHTVNDLADKHGGMQEAIHDVSVETGVPIERLQKMRDQHPDAGAAGLLIACVLADNTKMPAEQFLSRHVNGKGWAAIARDHNVPLDKIDTRLSNLQRELGTLPATGRDKGSEYKR